MAASIDSTSDASPGVGPRIWVLRPLPLRLPVCQGTGASSTWIVTAIQGLIGGTGISSELALPR